MVESYLLGCPISFALTSTDLLKSEVRYPTQGLLFASCLGNSMVDLGFTLIRNSELTSLSTMPLAFLCVSHSRRPCQPRIVPYLNADVDISWLSRYCTSGYNLSYFIRSTAITIEAWKKSAHSWKYLVFLHGRLCFYLPSPHFTCSNPTYHCLPKNVLYNAPHQISVNARQTSYPRPTHPAIHPRNYFRLL